MPRACPLTGVTAVHVSIFADRPIQPGRYPIDDANLAPGLTARLAGTPDVRREAYALRYAAYSSRGFIDAAPSGLFKDEWDEYPCTKTVVVYKDGVPAATARVCMYAPGSGIVGSDVIPAMDVFGSEIARIFSRIRGFSRGAEVMRLSRHPDLGADYEPVFAAFQMVGCLLLHLEVDAVVCAVRKHHMPFYRRLGFRIKTEPRKYPKLNFETALMASARPEGKLLQDALSGLNLISKEDINYQDFLAGREVPVFGTRRAAPKLGSIVERQFETIHAAPQRRSLVRKRSFATPRETQAAA